MQNNFNFKFSISYFYLFRKSFPEKPFSSAEHVQRRSMLRKDVSFRNQLSPTAWVAMTENDFSASHSVCESVSVINPYTEHPKITRLNGLHKGIPLCFPFPARGFPILTWTLTYDEKFHKIFHPLHTLYIACDINSLLPGKWYVT